MTESQGLQLQIQTIQFTPATVTFNADQIAVVLNLQLMKYKGLTFTEDSEAEAKKVIAELRKGKALLETYRKTTKAELTVAVTEFEQQIKGLAEKFDAVILPLTEQTERFESDRVNAKRTEIEKIISGLINKKMLGPQYARELIIPDYYLTRTFTMKKINTELLEKATQLHANQVRRESELALIRGNVALYNERLTGAGLLESTYTRLLESMSLEQVGHRLNEDVRAMMAREEQAEERTARAKAAAEERKRAAEAVAEAARNAFKVEPIVQQPTSVVGIQSADMDSVVQPSNITLKTYRVSGTVEEHAALSYFLADRLYDWSV